MQSKSLKLQSGCALFLGAFVLACSGGSSGGGTGGTSTSSEAGGSSGSSSVSQSGGKSETGSSSTKGGASAAGASSIDSSSAAAGSVSTGGSNGTGGKSTGTTGTGGSGTGGTKATGGSETIEGGTTTTGGKGTGGTGATGGTTSTDGTKPAGGSTGGSGTGGSNTGGSNTGGSNTGGSGTGGSNTGGSGTGGSGPATDADPSSGCGKAPTTITSSQYNNGTTIPITAANLQRRYILSVPKNYDNKKPYKLVIAFHQRDGNDKQMYANDYYHLLPLSKDSTIFVAPNGQLNGKPCAGTGNGEGSCGWPNPDDSDMLFTDAMVAQVTENFCVDKNRIFATGWSYGGSMSYAAGCERALGGTVKGVAGYIRAVALYSAALMSPFNGCTTPAKPVAFYASHGTSDSVLTYDGKTKGDTALGEQGGVGLCKNYSALDGCTWEIPAKVTSGKHQCTSMKGCMAGYPVQFCSFAGDHTPDPVDQGERNSWEYQTAWDFLNQF